MTSGIKCPICGSDYTDVKDFEMLIGAIHKLQRWQNTHTTILTPRREI